MLHFELSNQLVKLQGIDKGDSWVHNLISLILIKATQILAASVTGHTKRLNVRRNS